MFHSTGRHHPQNQCLKNDRSPETKHPWMSWFFPISGLLSLIWFLVRVVPKPSRAAYPCQRVAAPLASSFVIWMTGTLASIFAFRKGKKLMCQSRRGLAVVCLLVAAAVGTWVFLSMPERFALADDPVPNSPIGEAKGIFPGRVVWAFDPNATNWTGPGQGHWWEDSHTNQAAVNAMMSGALRKLSGKNTDKEAWDALIRSFNRTHGNGDVGYKPGEKVAVKINLVGCIYTEPQVNPETYELTDRLDYMNASPQMVRALLRQLVEVVGVKQEDLSIGDPLGLFPNQYYDMCHGAFPGVHYLDRNGGNAQHPRTRVEPSSVPFYWSSRPEGKTQDYVPDVYVKAKYFINMANFKAHTTAGVTLCAKNLSCLLKHDS